MRNTHVGKSVSKFLLCLFGILLLYSAFGNRIQGHKIKEVMSDTTIVTEAQNMRKTIRSANVDMTNIVTKHIPLGTPRESVEAQLAGLGFQAVYSKPSSDDDRLIHVIFSRQISDRSSVSSIGIYDEIRIFATFDSDKAVKLRGELIYKAL